MLTENKVSVLVQYSQTRDADFPSVPAMVDSLKCPGVAKDRVAALRAAFEAMAKSAEFRANVQKRKMELNIQKGAADLMSE